MFFGIEVTWAEFRPCTPRARLVYPWLSDILGYVVVEGGPNAAQAPRWVRNNGLPAESEGVSYNVHTVHSALCAV